MHVEYVPIIYITVPVPINFFISTIFSYQLGGPWVPTTCLYFSLKKNVMQRRPELPFFSQVYTLLR